MQTQALENRVGADAKKSRMDIFRHPPGHFGASNVTRTHDLLITNVGRSVKALISGAFCSFCVEGSAVYNPAASIQYIWSYSRLGQRLGLALLTYKIDFSKKSISVSITPCDA